ncbi:MAG: hypothetical protein IJY11_03920 [Clostridia bacterium]|nr:hypothetical protein [Clostridia bacterium]
MRSAKEIAYVAVFCALLIGGQFLLAAVPGVEIVTLLFVCYAYAFGVVRGCLCATAFSLLRQFVFGFFPTVLILYLVYYNLLCLCFGLLGRVWQGKEKSRLIFLVLIACAGTLLFNFIDIGINAIWIGYSAAALKVYFTASWSFTLPQIACTAVTVGLCFLPVHAAFRYAKGKLK